MRLVWPRRQLAAHGCWLLCAALPLVVPLLMAACDGSPSSPSPAASSGTPSAPSRVTAPSSPPHLTATRTPVLPGDAASTVGLGGSVAAFQARYGAPGEHSIATMGQYNFRSDQVIVYLGTFYGYPFTQVFTVTVSAAPGTAWDQHTALTTCLTFAPQPYRHLQDVPFVLFGVEEGVDEVYISPTLATRFPPQAFQDVEGHPVKPGTFDILLDFAANNDDTRITDCSIAVGAQQTK